MVAEEASPQLERAVVLEHVEEPVGPKLVQKIILSL